MAVGLTLRALFPLSYYQAASGSAGRVEPTCCFLANHTFVLPVLRTHGVSAWRYTVSTLPERSNLAHLRKQAKELLRQYRAAIPMLWQLSSVPAGCKGQRRFRAGRAVAAAVRRAVLHCPAVRVSELARAEALRANEDRRRERWRATR